MYTNYASSTRSVLTTGKTISEKSWQANIIIIIITIIIIIIIIIIKKEYSVLF